MPNAFGGPSHIYLAYDYKKGLHPYPRVILTDNSNYIYELNSSQLINMFGGHPKIESHSQSNRH
jgi:hypothetical protein